MIAIYDCMIINDELEILEARLAWIGDLVDHVVVIEALQTFSGKPKPAHVSMNMHRFAQWSHKLRCIVLDELPGKGDRWVAEAYQRDSILRGLSDAKPTDVAIVSDVDEFPDREVISRFREGLDAGPVGLEMASSFYRANWLSPLGAFSCAARAFPVGVLAEPHRQRNHVQPIRVIHEAGFHFTYLIDVDDMRRKFGNYAHSEMDNARGRSTAFLSLAQQYGLDPLSRTLIRVQPEDELLPVQRFMRQRRPEWFDWDSTEPWLRRVAFRFYAEWRWSCSDVKRVVRHDSSYPHASQAAVAIGAARWLWASLRRASGRALRRAAGGAR
jgi:beta-1,4-mannosyl-glycoprotein beta-1,4-N-acetylglucosaminyltransferase